MPRIACAGRSDVGRHRSNNEDALLMRPDLGFVALADGMGGAASGEVASAIFMEAAFQVFSERSPQSSGTAVDLVQKAFLRANERIMNKARQDPRHTGMGCTAELLAFDDQTYIVGHVGDSRTYLLRDGRLRQITKDHSMVQEQIDKGLITQEEAKTHSMRSVIMRAVGVNETLAIDLIRGKAQSGDLFLLCSDGLSDMVGDDGLLDTLSLSIDLQGRVEKLIDSANRAGGYDNITVALCLIE